MASIFEKHDKWLLQTEESLFRKTIFNSGVLGPQFLRAELTGKSSPIPPLSEATFIASQVPQCHGKAHLADLQVQGFLGGVYLGQAIDKIHLDVFFLNHQGFQLVIGLPPIAGWFTMENPFANG